MKCSKSIKSLQLYCLQGDAVQAILTGLSTNQSVETLELSWDMVLAAEQSSAQSVHNILKDTKKIKSFILTGLFRLTDTGHKEISKRIATALINSDCVTEIEFEGTGLHGGDLHSFQSILREKKNLRSLGLPVGCLTDQSMLELLARPKSPLRTLSLVGGYVSNPTTFTPFLIAVAKSRVEVLELGRFIWKLDGLLYSALIGQIPALQKLKELHFNDTILFPNALPQLDFLHAVKENFSLQKVTFESRTHINPQNLRQLAEYLKRNKRLANFAEKPESVSREVWPDALAMASNAPGTLFLASKSVLPEFASNTVAEDATA